MSSSDLSLNPPNLAGASTRSKPRSKRSLILKWLRDTHGWIGLWGATLGLVFGISGILLNHRSILKIPAAHTETHTVQLALPKSAPQNPKALAVWLQQELQLPRPASKTKSEAAEKVSWGDQTQVQPERWLVSFSGPQSSLQAEYWLGNQYVSVKRNEHNLFATLNNFHKGNGVGLAWILLADTLAGSIVFLSISGIVLWAMLNRRRMVGTCIGLVSLLCAAAIGFMAL